MREIFVSQANNGNLAFSSCVSGFGRIIVQKDEDAFQNEILCLKSFPKQVEVLIFSLTLHRCLFYYSSSHAMTRDQSCLLFFLIIIWSCIIFLSFCISRFSFIFCYCCCCYSASPFVFGLSFESHACEDPWACINSLLFSSSTSWRCCFLCVDSLSVFVIFIFEKSHHL